MKETQEEYEIRMFREAAPKIHEIEERQKSLNIIPSEGGGHDFSIPAEDQRDPILNGRTPDDGASGTGTPLVIVNINGAFAHATVPLSDIAFI
jgi:hypothetical protein